MTWEIQTRTVCDNWVNMWFDEDDNKIIFPTEEKAQDALKEHLQNLQNAVERGDMYDYNSNDYRVKEIT